MVKRRKKKLRSTNWKKERKKQNLAQEPQEDYNLCKEFGKRLSEMSPCSTYRILMIDEKKSKESWVRVVSLFPFMGGPRTHLLLN